MLGMGGVGTEVVGGEGRARGGGQVIRGVGGDGAVYEGHVHYRDGKGLLELPLPRLPGAHQADNAALAVAMIRHQSDVNVPPSALRAGLGRSEEHTSELQSLMRISYAVFCLKKKKKLLLSVETTIYEHNKLHIQTLRSRQ